ncbi:hypothetical protein TPHA_0K00830 [Tetrapisispora phaffii CBS 4417]|uniref:LCCL domain-containing protein n=1 Tax=Tetrapisispora phaffii (strain ATCC 24235 / CBS 4417 / NBRC 1672 / NRRL Y-8282 / UCD 70-5) TaxID=1071381 RepID=G8BZ89_TETPH|nr:hypothetical protein TPHA_0K00830 [Tetrapisispora phaffii CBS 4417]CCE65217.1 hypothetical protein TPHA_0K00830 [Tetrapisispora phaffii CBS 4417]
MSGRFDEGPSSAFENNGSDEFLENISMSDFNATSKQSEDANTRATDSRGESWMLLNNRNILGVTLNKIWNGPDEPSDEEPHFPYRWDFTRTIEEYPSKVFEKSLPNKKIRWGFLFFYCIFWYAVLQSLLHPYLFQEPFYYIKGDNNHEELKKIPIISLSCNSYLNWEGTNNACGINAESCGPFEDKEYFIRCPALCDQGGYLYSAVAVGANRMKYIGYQIGGGRLDKPGLNNELSYPYRADSFPCSAAVHAGIISPIIGGCARIAMDGSQINFPAREGKHGTGLSIVFNTFFPGSYTFKEVQEGIMSGCYDPRFLVLLINIMFGLVVFYLYKGIVGYWIITIVGYWTIVLATDPPVVVDPHDSYSSYELISVGFQRLLPLGFVLYVMWKCSIKRTLEEGSPLAKLLCWYPTFWLGVLNNVTFDRLPVDRLNATDLKEQAGALTAVLSILCTIITCAIIQAYSLWKSGRFQKYFKIYITLIISVVLLATLPGLNLRIHHYILGILLVPGCATRGTSAYLFQGILVGLILSGVARWDFASVVETDFALLRGEAGGSLEPPQFVFDSDESHKISWNLHNTTSTDHTGLIDGVSLLINDFEVYVGKNTTIDLDTLIIENALLNHLIEEAITNTEHDGAYLYLRIAQASTNNPSTNRGDYTNAGLLEWPQGVWHEPEPGVS